MASPLERSTTPRHTASISSRWGHSDTVAINAPVFRLRNHAHLLQFVPVTPEGFVMLQPGVGWNAAFDGTGKPPSSAWAGVSNTDSGLQQR